MIVETIGEAWQRGWRSPPGGLGGKRDGTKSVRAGIYRYGLIIKAIAHQIFGAA
jgi:hypothetical protein